MFNVQKYKIVINDDIQLNFRYTKVFLDSVKDLYLDVNSWKNIRGKFETPYTADSVVFIREDCQAFPLGQFSPVHNAPIATYNCSKRRVLRNGQTNYTYT